ncbi:MAG: Smr/MutS family protein [Acidobacteria bacterium]|nr:Smr/MutS family protein [Acidobacteriota bacterium]
MPRTAADILEFHSLRNLLRGYSTCEPGRRAIAALEFSIDRRALESDFAVIREAIAYLRAGSELGFGSLADPGPWLERIEAPAAVLAPHEFLDAASMMDVAHSLRESFREEAARFPLLTAKAKSLTDFRQLAAAIRRAIHPNGEISDDASSELRRIRTAMGRTRDKIQKTLRDILRARGEEQGEDYITLRNDRFVIPVRAADKRHVAGVVHAASATGQTVFLEPLEAIELNNRLVQLAEEEANEIARILRELTEHVQADRGPLRFAADTIAQLDSTFARGRFAREFSCVIPQFVEAQQLRLDAARHPVLEANLRKQSRAIVPMTLALGGSESVLVISGPNTGGKTVALKTAGMAALSAQSGIPVAADRAELPLFDCVLVDIGDEQSITADLSTFSAHVLNLRSMLEAATEKSLVLVDEMGTGTAPEEGSALAVAMLEEFRTRRCLTLATTHHDRLKAWATATAGILNAAVEFDDVNLRPTYRLMLGVPGGSSGIAIAQRLGLPEKIIAHARAQLAPETREAAELIAYLHKSRDQLEEMKRAAAEQAEALEKERRALQTEWAERQRKRLAQLEEKFVSALKQYELQITSLLGDIKDRDLRTRLEKEAQKGLKKIRVDAREEADSAVVQHLDESQRDVPADEKVTLEKLVPGAHIRVRGLAQPVVLRQLDGSTIHVQAGPLRMKVVLSDVTSIVPAIAVSRPGVPASNRHAALGQKDTAAKSGITVRSLPTSEPSADEINVIGCTVEEATERVDKFLDTAALAHKPSIRIIHGHGTGALRRGLAAFLNEHPLVESIAAEAADRGGSAVTVIQMKS